MIVLDTNVLIWWLQDSSKLSQGAKKEILKFKKKRNIYISSISIWEIALLVKRRKLDLKTEVSDWIEKLSLLPSLHFVPVDNKLSYLSVYLPEFVHKDPADRIIIATARELGAKLVTSDKKIRKYKYIETVW